MALPAPSDSAVPRRTNSMRGRVSSMGDTPASNGNVANIITVIRILLAPVFVWLLFADGHQFGPIRYLAAVLFILAIATDGLDGYLARRRNLVTDVGILLDPIADKVLIGGALVTLSILGEVWWWVTIVILVREFGITILRLSVLSKRVIPASRGGKLKTLLQAVAIALYLVPLQHLFGAPFVIVDGVVMGVAVVLTFVTGADYLLKAWRQSRAVA
ncbi:MAG: pgsA [Glaciihabitans sp.]|jgi:CDP-diacylglycerol--glycerol-3-phosphate 3-phosphatidyltransferase|nr:pgsA [Glaciihabitans sp.]MDQ1555320.1 CDP-diacylglycerol---glycerol-3-phosphate 3-phosphatidyltransferase [Actinomycetota bacterium]